VRCCRMFNCGVHGCLRFRFSRPATWQERHCFPTPLAQRSCC
jgi:hypothetical protein